MKNKITNLLIFLTIILSEQLAYSKPNILVSITPIASLVSMLTKDKADIITLDITEGCPHHHSAKPSDKSLVDNSDMVIYIDDQFDSLVPLMLSDYKGKKVKISDFTSIDFKGIDGQLNWHFWLSLNNVRILQNSLAEKIIQTFPEIKDTVQKNLEESLDTISGIGKWKRFKLMDLPPTVLLSDSLEHFFKSINNSQVQVFQTSNSSLKNIQNLDTILSSSSIKCIVLDTSQNSQLYSKYQKILIQLNSENWSITDNKTLNENLFINQYSKMIDQLSNCK